MVSSAPATTTTTSFSEAEIKKRIAGVDNRLFHNVRSNVLDTLLQKGELQTLQKDVKVFNAGDKAGWFYIVIDGTIYTQLHNVNIRPLMVAEVGGLTSSLTRADQPPDAIPRRSMSHVVSTDTATILRVPHNVYRGLLENDRDFAVRTVQYLHSRLRGKTSVMALLTGSQASMPGGDNSSPQQGDLKIAVFDAKPYDREYFKKAFAPAEKAAPRMSLKFLDAKLGEDTVGLAVGCNTACIFVNDVCNAKVLLGLRSAGVELVLLRCAGFNNVNLKVAAECGITVLRVPAYSPHAVAEHAFALLSTVNRRTNRAYNRVRDGNFALAGLEGRDLHGLTAGVAGCGKIGQCFIDIAKGYGMKVAAWDRNMSPEDAEKNGIILVKDFKELMRMSDVLSLHLPLTKTTKHLVNEETLRLMPKGAIVINTSRGPIIDAKALSRCLVDGHLGGAGLDVYEEEAEYFFEDRSSAPITDDTLARLVSLPNVVITSHQAFLTDKALAAIAQTTFENAAAFQKARMAGKPHFSELANVVTAPKKKSDEDAKKTQSKL